VVLPLVVLIWFPNVVVAQPPPRPSIAPVLRIEGGMLNPIDPFHVTVAAGAAVGVRVRRVDVLLRGMRQNRNGYTGADLVVEGRTFWGVTVEYAAAVSQSVRREGLMQLGAGRLHRAGLGTAWFLQAGVGGRYYVAPPVALMVSFQDVLAFLPAGEARAQHNLAVLLGVELVP
jgi:hypothetical protein